MKDHIAVFSDEVRNIYVPLEPMVKHKYTVLSICEIKYSDTLSPISFNDIAI